MIVCVAVTHDGLVAGGWGRAERVAVAAVSDGDVADWKEHDVGWGRLHDSGPEGEHHARIARFLQEHAVEAVVAEHMGPPMRHMLHKMGIQTHLGVTGAARPAALLAAAGHSST
jgi:predicted Fe-Mo cluster-binding NifX family protein